MIEVNLAVPSNAAPLDSEICEDFEIIYRASNKLLTLYIIKTTEEKVTFLKLRYGIHNVWKR